MPLIHICLHHGGQFVAERGLQYVGGQIDYIDDMNLDKISFHSLKMAVQKFLKYYNVKALWYLMPGMSFEQGGIRRLYSNEEVEALLKDILGCNMREIDIFVEHSVDDDAILHDVLGFESSFRGPVIDDDCVIADNCNGGDAYEMGWLSSESKDEAYNNEDENVSLSSNYGVSEGDLEGETDEELVKVRREKIERVNVKNRTLIPMPESTNIVMLDLEAQKEVERDMFAESSESEVEISSSEDDEVRVHHRRKKKPKGKSFNPKTDLKNVNFFVGLEFANADEFKNAIDQYAVTNSLDLKYMKNQKDKVCLVCNNSKICPWRIYASKEQNEGTFKIKTYNSVHKCAENIQSRQLRSKWLARQFYTRIRDEPHLRLETMQAEVLAIHKLNVHRSLCNRAKQIVLCDLMGSMKEHYGKLWNYKEELERTNIGTVVDIFHLQKTPDLPSFFYRIYICFDALKKGLLGGCRPVLGIDGCFLKGIMKGELLIAVGRDANNQMWPVAWAVVQVENNETWSWFIQHLIDDLELGDGYGWTIISDQQKGLLNAIGELLPRVEHRACARHVYANWNKLFKGTELKRAFWKIAKATHKDAYLKACEELKTLDKDAFSNLMTRDVHKWCKLFFCDTSKCDNCENNMSEGFNGFLVAARSKPLIYLLEDLRIMMMTRITKRKIWLENHWDSLCPRIRRRLDENMKDGAKWKALYNGSTKYEVTFMKEGFVVDIEKRSCTCRVWDLTGIPCCHACSSIMKLGKHPEVFVADWYKTNTFIRTYSNVLEPISGEDNWQKSTKEALLPPLGRTMPGRPKKNRVKEVNEQINKGKEKQGDTEKLTRQGRNMTCSNCKEIGHNKRGCKKPKDVSTSFTVKSKPNSKKGKNTNQTPRVIVYSKTRNGGRPKVNAGGSAPRKRGRPSKPRCPFQLDGVGLYNSPSGDTYFRSPGSSTTVRISSSQGQSSQFESNPSRAIPNPSQASSVIHPDLS